MKYNAKPPTIVPPKPDPIVPPNDVSIQRLIEDGLIILYREIKNLMMLSVKGKLDAASARDLRDHLKLLFELKEQEAHLLNGLTDEQMQDTILKDISTEKLREELQRREANDKQD